MVEAGLVLEAVLYWFVPAILLVGLFLYVAYLVYDTRERRAEIARAPRPVGPDPVDELRRLHGLQAVNLAEGRATLEKARDTLRRGIKG